MGKCFELYHYLTKRSKTTKKQIRNTMIIIDIENKSVVKTMSEINESLPLDFYLPNPNEQHYDNFHNFLFGELDSDKLENYSPFIEERNKIVDKTNYIIKEADNGLNIENPENDDNTPNNEYKYTFDVPFVKNTTFTENLPVYYHKKFTQLRDHNSLPLHPRFSISDYQSYLVCYNWEGPVPAHPLIQPSGDSVTRYLQRVLEKFPVMHQKHSLLSPEEYYRDTKENTTITCLKAKLPLLCYYMKRGPFAKCWIRFSYDPRLCPESYKYQRIAKYRLNDKLNFVFDDFVLLSEIEQNKDCLLREDFCLIYGWFRVELINYIKKYVKKRSIEQLVL